MSTGTKGLYQSTLYIDEIYFDVERMNHDTF